MGIGIGIGMGISPGVSAGGLTPTAAPELTYVFEWDGSSQAAAAASGKTYDVDWGDGRGLLTGQVGTTRSAYSGAAQDYTVKISGLIPSANFPYLRQFMSSAGTAQKTKVKEIISFGTSIEWQRIYNDLGNMVSITNLNFNSLKLAPPPQDGWPFNAFFNYCKGMSNLQSIDFTGWDSSRVAKGIYNPFTDCFNLSSMEWDVNQDWSGLGGDGYVYLTFINPNDSNQKLMTTAQYDTLLNTLATSAPSGINGSLDVGTVQYSASAATDRQTVASKGISVTDGGQI